MQSIHRYIFEAGGKPSDVKKYKKTSRTETVHFRSGDIYDLSDPGYDDEFTYYDGSGNGYIKDKEGHVYDVVVSDTAGDAGRIAGGSHDYYVCIKKANGKDDFVVRGYTALFSSGSNTGCIADIKVGHYLEDYIAKYYSEYTHGDKFKELAQKGNANAKSYETERQEKAEQKKQDFDARYLMLPKSIKWEIDDDFNILGWSPGNGGDELKNTRKERDNQSYNSPEWKELNKKVNEIQKKADDVLFAIFKPILVKKIQEIFKTKDIMTLQGVGGTFDIPEKYYTGKKDWGKATLAIDTKKNTLVTIHTGDRKVIDDHIEMTVGDLISIDKSKMNDKTEKLFKTVAKAWKKTEGRKQTEYIENRWRQIQKDSGGFWSWNKNVSQSKKEAKQEFLQMVKNHNWDSNKKLTFSLSLVQMYVEGDFDPNDEPIENPLENPEPKERGKNTKMSKGAQAAAYDKMKAWHEGTRKQNLSNCSDAKLKMNYKVCKELGYENEMKQIEAEAEKRQLTLESLSIIDYV